MTGGSDRRSSENSTRTGVPGLPKSNFPRQIPHIEFPTLNVAKSATFRMGHPRELSRRTFPQVWLFVFTYLYALQDAGYPTAGRLCGKLEARFPSLPMSPYRRISDRINGLFARLAGASEAESMHVIKELHRTLAEYSLRVRNRTTATVLKWPDYPRDRRKAEGIPTPGSEKSKTS